MIKKILFFTILYILIFKQVCTAQNSTTSAFRCILQEDTVRCNTTTEKKLFIIADSIPIYKDAILKIAFPKSFTDYAYDDMLWIIFPPNVRAGYLQAYSVSSGKRAQIINVLMATDEFTNIPSSAFNYDFSHENNVRIITIKMLDTLPKGDTLLIHYGANGNSTFTYNSNVEQKDKFTIFINNNTSNYSTLQSKPSIYFKHGNAQKIRLVQTSLSKKNQDCLLKIMINDATNNLVNDFTGTINLSSNSANIIMPNTITFMAADNGHKDVSIRYTENGNYTIYANAVSSNMPITGTFTSNPIFVSNDSMQLFWGDFHTHTQFSRDGFGSNSYEYAKNAIGLDFFCATDHSDMNQIDTFGINTLEWNNMIQQSKSVHQNKRFISFLGYENSLDNPSGHYNFIYNYADSNTSKIPMLARHFQFNIQNFWTKLNQMNVTVEAMTIPHHTGKIFSANGQNAECSRFGGTFKNDKYKRLIEIYSAHGLCESFNPNHNLSYEKFNAKSTTFPCYAQDAWALREYLGVIASTDSHSGQAAANNIGICAVYADSLTRDNIFHHAYNRHTYATTGERIILKLSINNHMMGDTFSVRCDSLPFIKTQVIGTDNIDYIELLKWDFINGTSSGNQKHPNFEILKKITPATNTTIYNFNYVDVDYRDSSIYYIRCKQKNNVNNREVWAWSSPIWVFSKNCHNQLLKSDSIYDFKSQNINNYIQLNWSIDNELKTENYIIQSSTDSIHFNDIGWQNASQIPLLDTNYLFKDSIYISNPVYYRIKQVFYNDGLKYSKIIRVIFPNTIDSIVDFNTSLCNTGILNDWQTKEFRSTHYTVQRSATALNYQSIQNISAKHLAENNYNYTDTFPFEDVSFYRIVQHLPIGNYIISKTNSIYFPYDTILNIDANIESNKIKLCWQITNQADVQNYILQRSNDSINYINIDTIAFSGNLFDTISYCLYDTSPLFGKNYYRIIVNRIQKPDELSIIKLVNYRTTGIHTNYLSDVSMKIFDNLITEGSNQLFIQTNSKKRVIGKLLLFDILGNTYLNETKEIEPNNNYFYLPTATLQHGKYFVIFNYNNEIIKLDFMVVDGE